LRVLEDQDATPGLESDHAIADARGLGSMADLAVVHAVIVAR
jgi:hypothetical protein